ncbi:glycosyltransferase family 2 protein [Bradyrhizobium sp. HKCCYLS2038]|uniref:glycosyltransferase family 2 protein n=1 Tax=unclassified Bradyrhizobium TaxID=2631580 RepID=UPI003EBD559B
MTLVSVIMSMRNSAATVAAAVRSVQLQTWPNWELIVIDDGSTDRSAAIVTGFHDPRIRLVREPGSAGLAARLNQAVGLSRGELIARMDADDICFPERLARQVHHLQENVAIDLLGCGAVVFSEASGLVGTLPVGLSHTDITAQPRRGFPMPHPTWCGRASWFRAHPYDPALRKTQDQDLLLRTYALSRFACLPDILLGYRQDDFDLRKVLTGRRAYAGALWRQRAASGIAGALGGIAGQLLKGAVDGVATGLGLTRLAQRRRLKPVPPAIVSQWAAVQRQLSGGPA